MKRGEIRFLLDTLNFYGTKIIYYRSIKPYGVNKCKIIAFEESLRFEEGYSFFIEDDILLERDCIKLLKEVLDNYKHLNSVSPVSVVVTNDLIEIPNFVPPDKPVPIEDRSDAYLFTAEDRIIEKDIGGKPVIMVRDNILRERMSLIKRVFDVSEYPPGIDNLLGRILKPFAIRTTARVWDISENLTRKVMEAADAWLKKIKDIEV
jgi:hypothetical protein